MTRKCACVALLFTGMVLTIAFVGVARYGSTRAAVASLQGMSVLVENTKKSFGTVRIGETRRVAVDLRNLGHDRIELVGCRYSCDCVDTSELPTFMNPDGRKRLHFDITPSRASAEYVTEVTIFTNVPTQPQIALSFAGIVLER